MLNETTCLSAFISAHDATAARIIAKQCAPCVGDLIGVRLNLNVLKNTGVAVQTLHRATNQHGYTKNKGFFRGEVVGYAKTVHLQNAYFNVDQLAREEIACGREHKSAMASIDGVLVNTDDTLPMNYVEVRFNPKEVHLFVDTEGKAIRYADKVVVQGHRAYVSGRIEYHSEKSAPIKHGTAPSRAALTGEQVIVKEL